MAGMFVLYSREVSKFFAWSSFLSSGPSLPKKIYGLSMIDFMGDLYAIGGFSEDAIEKAIYKFSCVSGNCQWTILSQHLKVARGSTLTIPVSNSIINCNNSNWFQPFLDETNIEQLF